jgi:uncharacterized protein (DUF2249 family)
MSEWVIRLDVSTLEPPQPMRVISQALTSLTAGEVVYVIHRRKPVPFFDMLEARYCYRHLQTGEQQHHIWFWLTGDSEAQQRAEAMWSEPESLS